MRCFFYIISVLIFSIILSQNAVLHCFAQQKPENSAVKQKIPAVDISNNAQEELNEFYTAYIKALGARDIKKISNLYASNFVSSDNFNKSQMIEIFKQTWQKYPDIRYTTTFKNLRVRGDNANIEFWQNVDATTKAKSEITKDTGIVTGRSQEILYLEKYGSGWKIVTEKTLYEELSVKYGRAKSINFSLDVPEQVISGEEYTIALKVDLPADVFSLASISSSPITFPTKPSEEVFRQIPADTNLLERVIKTNKNSLNEISSGSISFCEAQSGSYTGLDLRVSGIAVILRRVNVLPLRI